MTMCGSERLGLVVAVGLLLGAVVILLVGCDLSPAEPTAVLDVPVGTPGSSQPTAAPTNVGEVAPPEPSVITLTVWTTEAFSPTQAITSGQILAQQAASFEEDYAALELKFVLKKSYGKGGILDYLLTTEAVVPELLPDVAFIDIDELGAAVNAGVVQPLDDLIPPDLAADLYTFAREACTLDGRLYCLQFQADLDHLVYNTGQMTVPPSSWPGVLSNPGPYAFPAGGQMGLVNDDFLIQYLAVRPWPMGGDPDAPFLELDSLTAVLQFYQDGVSRGVFPVSIVDYHTTDDCWRDYLASEVALTHVSAHRYLLERDGLQSSAVAPIPAVNGPGAAIGRGWALVLVASDPARQSAALEFMTRLMSPETNGSWNRAAGYLPTRQAALALWDGTDSYTRFAQQQLETAQSRPRLPNYTQVAAALQEAVKDVITGVATPEDAALQAIEGTQ
jgi:ABC-type glycerol-3-phosphate transport system substrate-binding protein